MNDLSSRFVMLPATILTFLLILLANSLANAAELQDLSISGWYSECNLQAQEESTFENACQGLFEENLVPAPIDITGETCYVNPLLANDPVSVGVFWFGPLVGNEGTYLFSNLLFGDRLADKPTECDGTGACVCGPFEEIRKGWNTSGSCAGGCSTALADPLTGTVGQECATFFILSTIDDNGTEIGMCPVLGKVQTNESTSAGNAVTNRLNAWSVVAVSMAAVAFDIMCYM